MADSRASDLLVGPYGLQLLSLVSQRPAADFTDDDLTGLLSQLEFYVSRYRSDYEPYIEALRSNAPELRHMAAWLPQRMVRWWHDLDRNQQVWAGRSAGAPVEAQLIVDLSPFNAETPKPRQAFWTSTFVPTVISPWLDSPEAQFSGPPHAWKVTVTESARVLEINSPAAWFALAHAYPGAREAFRYSPQYSPRIVRPAGSSRLDPDWSKVSQDWDGVHVSVGGWMTAEDVPYESAGVTTELRGWNMESTVWFRWSFSSVEPLPVA